nr:MAG TPA: hypothetical protein [Caudoviricetes sp.]
MFFICVFMPKIEMFYVGGLILGKIHQYQNLLPLPVGVSQYLSIYR